MGKAKAKKEAKSKALTCDHGSVMAAMIEDAEAQLLVAETQGKIIEKLAYSFQGKGNALVEGLTFWGMLACAQGAKKKSWTPQWTKPEFQPLADGQILCVIGCRNPVTKLTEWGTCSFNPKIRFDERKALTNAKRYALDKHLPVVQKVSFLHYLKEHKMNSVLQLHEGAEVSRPTRITVSDSGKVSQRKLTEKAAEQTTTGKKARVF